MASFIPIQEGHKIVGRKSRTNRKRRKSKKRKSPLAEVRAMNETTPFELAKALYSTQGQLRGILFIAPDFPVCYFDNLEDFSIVFSLEEDSEEYAEFCMGVTERLWTYSPWDSVLIAFPSNDEAFLRNENSNVRVQLVPQHHPMAKVNLSLPKPLAEFSSEELNCFIYEGK